MLSLDQAPAGVSEALWLNSPAAARPESGDLWLLSWDGVALGLGVVTRVAPDFVACWPVTFADVPVFAPAVIIEPSPLGVVVLAWPTRETGVGLHILHRRFGQLLSPATIALVEVAMDAEPQGDLPLPLADRNVDGVQAEGLSDAMVDEWEAICLNVWPRPTAGATPLNADALQALDVQVSDLAAILNVPVPTAVSFMRGEYAPTAEQIDTLARTVDADADELLASQNDESQTLLVDPRFKDAFLRLSELRAISEADARDLVRTDFALAARSDGDDTARLTAIIDRLERSS